MLKKSLILVVRFWYLSVLIHEKASFTANKQVI